MTNTDVLILGAGAAGLMAALEAGRRGRSVIVLDHADRPGKKILISGGGRCNFTNLHTRAENFLSANPHFAKSALARYTPRDFVALVEKHGIPYHEKTLGQLFCDRHAQDIVTLLERECAESGVRLALGERILSVTRPDTFVVETSTSTYTANSLIVATGGLSIPKMGATSLGYDLAQQFGHTLIPTRPGLVPLVLNPDNAADWCDLTGLSAETIASAPGAVAKRPRPTFREKLLITHRGLSGPAVLQISSFWQPGQPVAFDLAPGQTLTAPLLAPKAQRDQYALAAALRAALPGRLADRWTGLNPPAPGSRDYTNAALAQIETKLHAWQVTPAGTEGYAKAEVTAGGVNTAELDARTLESKKVPGLYFIGEVVDVTGWLGGYNFQWAWASGFSAGQSA